MQQVLIFTIINFYTRIVFFLEKVCFPLIGCKMCKFPKKLFSVQLSPSLTLVAKIRLILSRGTGLMSNVLCRLSRIRIFKPIIYWEAASITGRRTQTDTGTLLSISDLFGFARRLLSRVFCPQLSAREKSTERTLIEPTLNTASLIEILIAAGAHDG